MDYATSIKHIERTLDQRRIQPAMQEMGSTLEHLLKELYRDYLARLKPADRADVSNQERETAARVRSRSGNADTFTLGQFVRFLQASDFWSKAQSAGLSVRALRDANLEPFVEARNEATHQAKPPSENEARLYFHLLVQVLEEAGKLTTISTLSDASTLKPWTDVVTPHPDIRDGRLEISTYAADLWAVAFDSEHCPDVYRTADTFFAATYLTKNLSGLLGDVMRALNGETGDRVLQLRTPFGGGKTHSLIALYHLVTCSNDERDRILAEIMSRHHITLTNPGFVHFVVIHGLGLDVMVPRTPEPGVTIHTLWGELAYQIGGKSAYAVVQEQDESRVAPGKVVLQQILGNHSVLLLLDELLVYTEKAYGIPIGQTTYGRQVLIFLQTLTETIRGLAHAVMVYSLQASQGEAFGAEGLLTELDHLVSRIDSKREPVSGDEVLKVIQRRLFSDLGTQSVRDTVAHAYAERYRGHIEADDPTGAAQAARRMEARILDSYPLHPDLLSLMYHRWGSLPSYQRTRGALGFLATVISAIYQNPELAQPLLGPGDVLLEDDSTRNALFTQIGEREHYDSVLAADIIGGERTQDIDRRMGEASPILRRLRVGTRVATAAFLYSFGARQGEDRGVVRDDLIAACLSPDMDRNIITSALHDLQETLLYLHYVGGRYRFETKPNLNKLIADQARQYEPNEIMAELKRRLDRMIGSVHGSDARSWPDDSAAIPDHQPRFQIAYLGTEWADLSRNEIEQRAHQWIEMRGSSRRNYKNGLALAIPTAARLDEVRMFTRNLLAADSLRGARGRYSLSKDQVEDLENRVRHLGNDIDSTIKRLYDVVALPIQATASDDPSQSDDPIQIEWIDLRAQPLSGEKIQERIFEALRTRVFTSMTPGKLVGLTRLGQDVATQTVNCATLVDWCFSFLTFPKLLGSDPIRNAIMRGVQDGLFGYSAALKFDNDQRPFISDHRLIKMGVLLNPVEIDLSATSYLIAPELAQRLAQPPAPTMPTENGDISSETPSNTSINEVSENYQGDVSQSSGEPISSGITKPVSRGKHYRLRFTANKRQLFQSFRPLQNLAEKAEQFEVIVEVMAQSNTPLEANWIRNAVEEPLDEADVLFDGTLEDE
ncbi:MAG: DUF499 domain-containing protein [Chloroflexota bacterium]